jgi:hypothetical protein
MISQRRQGRTHASLGSTGALTPISRTYRCNVPERWAAEPFWRHEERVFGRARASHLLSLGTFQTTDQMLPRTEKCALLRGMPRAIDSFNFLLLSFAKIALVAPRVLFCLKVTHSIDEYRGSPSELLGCIRDTERKSEEHAIRIRSEV